MHSPIPATPTANWKKFTWHNQHCTDLAQRRRRRLQAKGGLKNKAGGEAEAAPAGHISSPGCVCTGGFGEGEVPNSQTTALGACLGLLTSHRLRVTPQKSKPWR